MNDLNQIHKANHASIENSAIQAARREGKFVIANYDGLHLVGHTQHGTREAAVEQLERLSESRAVSERLELLAPTA